MSTSLRLHIQTHQIEVVCWLIHKYLIGVNVVLVLLCSFNITDGWVKGSLQNLKFLGMLVIRIAVGICRDLRKKSLLPFDVLLTTYDIALVDQDFLSQVPWYLMKLKYSRIPTVYVTYLEKFIEL
ncbi:hypothetical protein IGI04_002033 [Brassica rapa subsp. trilocularis]|uniref:Uncharacterized protein n=1 Tax=Brassica rapa subsp. trilocularis TaxID=1813537 RepID=A0ABQ7NUC5_BRACM|nr:hypothetical protein IGI04_002033 [Brassica rapa subsp. trilocularis]